MSRVLAAAPVACALLVLTLTSAVASQQGGTRQAPREDLTAYLPPGDGQALVVSRCSGCHDLRGTIQLRKAGPAWEAIVLDMGARGAPITLDEIDPLVKYLSSAFGPNAPPFTDANAATKADLTKLPGVTPEAADRLIAARASAPLVSDEQVRTALALDPQTYEKIKYYVYVKPSTRARGAG